MRWRRLEEKSRKELRISSHRIEESRSGVPSGRTSDWKLGSSPSKKRETR